MSNTPATDPCSDPDAAPDEPTRDQRAGAGLSGRLATVLSDYRAALETAALSPHARRGYASRVAGFLDWLATGPDLGADVDPLAQPTGRDYAVRDYRSWLKTVRRATPWTVNAHLTALDHFYAHLGLGAPVIKRERITATAPESLDEDEQRRFLRACDRCGSTPNAAIGKLLLYTGLRVEEVEALDLDDIVISARRGKVIVRDGKGGVYREVPLHRAARTALRAWLDEHPQLRGADETRALFLSRRGERMRVRALRYVVRRTRRGRPPRARTWPPGRRQIAGPPAHPAAHVRNPIAAQRRGRPDRPLPRPWRAAKASVVAAMSQV